MAINSRDDIVILSTADWDNPFWTNKQHVAVELSRRGHRVLYVDSLGLRRPSVTGRDLRRIFRRVFSALRPPLQVRNNIWVWSPLVLPFHGVRIVRVLNRLVLSSSLKFWMAFLGLRAHLLWTYNPITLELLQVGTFRTLVYHCVDEIKAQPGMPVATIESAEKGLVERSDLVFVTAQTLGADRRTQNSNIHYFPNVADYDHFSTAMSRELAVPADLLAISAPRIGFIGAISSYKLDFDLIVAMAEKRPDWSLIFIGQVGEGEPGTDVSRLNGHENIYLLGPRSYDSLPSYLKGFNVALLPNRLNDYTRGMFPMKFFEYLAAGKPVVSTGLESLREFSDYFLQGDTPEGFMAAIEGALSGKGASLEERLDVARQHTYRARMEKMMARVEEITASQGNA